MGMNTFCYSYITEEELQPNFNNINHAQKSNYCPYKALQSNIKK